MIMWLPVVGEEDRYLVSNEGVVWSVEDRANLSPSVDHSGYMALTVRGQPKRLHSIVLEAFEGPLPSGMVTRHLNGDAEDNNLSNLIYGTYKQNAADTRRHGTHGNTKKMTCPRGHSYDKIGRRGDGRTFRVCSICHREKQRAWDKKKYWEGKRRNYG